MKIQAALLAVTASLTFSASASATVGLNLVDGTNLGNFGAPATWSESFTVSGTGAIDHTLGFTITEDLYAGSGVFDIPLEVSFGAFTVTVYNIDNLSASIYDSTNALYTAFVPADGNPDHLTLPQGSFFATGSYTLKIGGTATGSAGAMYTIAAVTAPVPEPETWGMLLAGLGMVALQLRRKTQAQTV